ncbi:hypothetical protein GCM10020000_71770 [Streptomyces olivoverticillatus]
MYMAQTLELTVGERTVRLSNPDKVYFPRRGFTKADVARYYLSVGDGILRALKDRPTTLERYPDGVEGESFFQKRAPKNLPEWIPTGRIAFPSGRYADEICPTETAAVLWAANLGCLTFHPWPVRRSDTDHPDELRIDLDPQPGTGYPEAVRAALELREVLAGLGLTGWPKTSGGRGLHVFVPIAPQWTFVQVRRAAIAVARELERGAPERITTAWWKEERGEKVFVDYNQTARDRTIASAYSVRPPRACPGLRAAALGGAARRRARGLRPGDHARSLRRARRRPRGHGRPPLRPGGRAGAGRPGRARPRAGGDLPYPPEHPKMKGEPKRVQPSRAKK